MMRSSRRAFAATTSLLALSALSASALAADKAVLEQAELAQLSPELREQVKARMTNGQTVRGILETMLLNNISALFAANRVTAVDFQKGIVVFENKDGTLKAIPFDTATLVIKA
jgi:hypothetical protein